MRETTPKPAPARPVVEPSDPPSAAAPPSYEVGRNKPPRHSQFKPGVSGNPGGRKKGSQNLRTLFCEVMGSEVSITKDGQRTTVPVGEALVWGLVQAALRGDVRASNSLLDRFERYSPDEAANDDELPAEDRALLERALSRLQAAALPLPRTPATEPDDDAE
jgi:hypothetical protein